MKNLIYIVSSEPRLPLSFTTILLQNIQNLMQTDFLQNANNRL